MIEPDRGYAIYNGDNKSSQNNAFDSRGNKLIEGVLGLYANPKQRMHAPPILIFTQCIVDGNIQGYRAFSGYGIPTNVQIKTQKEKGTSHYFTNLIVEIALFGLEKEDEWFDWRWIDARRDASIALEDSLTYAPSAWKKWVKHGPEVIEKVRRRVVKYKIVSKAEQQDYSDNEKAILQEVVDYFDKLKRHPFEGLASLITQRVIGGRYYRGWITQRSGDGGIDYVSRLNIGDEFSTTSVVILGQAKCISLTTGIPGEGLARVVARLQRGWIGAFVTTGYFTEKAQMELYQDGYPIILINGKRLAQELKLMMNEEGVPLRHILERETMWYYQHIEPLEAIRILER